MLSGVHTFQTLTLYFFFVRFKQNHGVHENDIKKLQDAGICTVRGLGGASRKFLTQIKGLSEPKVEKLKAIAKGIESDSFQSASSIAGKRKHLVRISTGCSKLDDLLQGGIESGSVTEVYGEYRTGKTQLMHTCAVMAQLPVEQGGGGGKVMYIDTEGTFRPERIAEIANARGTDPSAILENIAYAKANNTEHQAELLVASGALLAQDHFALIIVDSATNLYRTEFEGRGELSARQMALGKFLRHLAKLASEYGCSVLVSNQVVANPEGGMFAGANAQKPIGGNIMAHASTTRLALRKGRGTNRIMKIACSPTLPENECEYGISEAGIDEPCD